MPLIKKKAETHLELISRTNSPEKEIMELDLISVSEWMGCSPSQLLLNQATLPAANFKNMVSNLKESYQEWPFDEQRMHKILRKIKAGATLLPVFIEKNDSTLFIMEGRHRIVAFIEAGITEIPIVFISIVKPKPTLELSPSP